MTTIKVLDQGFIELVDSMGNDHFICRAARTSYGKDSNEIAELSNTIRHLNDLKTLSPEELLKTSNYTHTEINHKVKELYGKRAELIQKDRDLIRRLMRDRHTSPFEMVEFVFCVQVPMDCWRQWIRHRTANVNEYSTRYSEALDFFQKTDEHCWRLQAVDNKQGSSGMLEEWPEGTETAITNDQKHQIVYLQHKQAQMTPLPENGGTPGGYLSNEESKFHSHARQLYEERLKFGIAREQARKDLPLSTYTRAYWKCDLHNIFNFLELRMDSHAQLEIRSYANAMAELVKQVCPMAFEAFMDYRVNGMKLSRLEILVIQNLCKEGEEVNPLDRDEMIATLIPNKTERTQCLKKLEKLGLC